MFRTYVINLLTQTSTWYGIIFMFVAMFLPHSWIFVIGLLIFITDDTRIQKFFTIMRQEIELWWPK